MDIIFSLCLVVIIYLCYLMIIVNERRLKKYIEKSKETTMLKRKYNLNYEKIGYKKTANAFGIINAITIGFVYTVMELINNLFIKIFVALIMLIVLLLIFYTALGKCLKKGMNK